VRKSGRPTRDRHAGQATAIDNQCNIVGGVTDASGISKAFLLSATPGDANLDGTVNINDLSKVLTNYAARPHFLLSDAEVRRQTGIWERARPRGTHFAERLLQDVPDRASFP
jgi:hypothetical protein